jgi:hypothetical protein
MKRTRKWSADNRAGEGHPAEPGGPLRRRRALRKLDSLALDRGRDRDRSRGLERSPAAATAHVRVLGEPGELRVAARTGTDSVPRGSGSAPGEPGVHAVPVDDQPFGASGREP